ncbi:CDP-glucose 4,6-dehydratase [Rhizobium lentis]|uniref:CDP-glucose 4,6-dehydratase n=1 Tax=Rhizobium lentis TaxID=1138194 RepID=UPI001A92BAD1|nr:CDP-glucose 4,6-dehydratase [Rhizobium lentis]MBX4998477.1 CDP-glucose 4,6-dehydratase [Rhizobium lentis]MBX5017079.1 CDP-glucose 4,6-dehydratase [Rhizobium lentis]MBX5065936.1 CDP-glucose 4,6-dehydratase [Rhizobium lentis]MBX5078989.1 CDP-glucose 4,6-dehydratase [Rhizobium lentis]QSW95782.1 CDP-glucose 4,6-dehydratase [Rhizobium lentis]
MGLTDFWNGRRVFLTGHTGFKGSWLSLWLEKLGAEVTAVSLEPETNPSLYARLSPWNGQGHHIADIRDAAAFMQHVIDFEPEIVIHMAAQALVRRSYENPAETFATNVMGTANMLDAVRETPSVKTVLVVTSDKVYANNGSGVPFIESDTLGGKDPYSNSKACTELVVQSYRDSFFKARDIKVATARAGNVIGGGDWSKDRLIPDFIRAFESNQPIQLRYPEAIRPWQHVLEPLGGYLAFAQALTLAGEGALPEALNFGPDPQSFAMVYELAEALGVAHGMNDVWKQAPGKHLPEAPALTLSSALALDTIGWRPRLTLQQTIDWTAAWYQANREGADMRAFSLGQIAAYEEAIS